MDARARGSACLFAVMSALAPGQAHAYCLLTTESPEPNQLCTDEGNPLLWRRQCISYSVAERADARLSFDEVRDIIDVSFGSWMAVECGDRPFGISLRQTRELARCEEPEHNPTAGNANSIVFVNNWSELELPEDALGVTVIWHDDSGEIFDADMQINETMGEYDACDGNCPSGVVDLQNVVTHEAGHFLGLGHSPVPTAAMHGEARPGETRKRYLGNDDRAGLCALYGSLESPSCTTTDYQPRGGLALSCYEPSDGCAVASVGRRRSGLVPALSLLALALSLRSRSVKRGGGSRKPGRRRPTIRRMPS